MKFRNICSSICGLSMLLFASCIDSNYDLANIDTTTRIQVNDLVIPINLDPIMMSDLLEIREGDNIQIADNRYAIVTNGEFTSDQINIEPFTIPAPMIIPLIQENESGISDPLILDKTDVTIDVKGHYVAWQTISPKISDDIRGITEIKSDCDFIVALKFLELFDKVNRLELNDVVIQLPPGLTIFGGNTENATYDSETGLMTISQIVSETGNFNIRFRVSAFDAQKAHITFDNYAHAVRFDNSIQLLSAKLVLKKSDFKEGADYSIPNPISIETAPYISDIAVTSISGSISHTLTGFDIKGIDLSTLPDMLRGSGTDLKLVNPQIYLRLINPLRGFGIHAISGLSIQIDRGDKVFDTFSIDDPGYFTIQAPTGENPSQTFCFSPQPVNTSPVGFDNPTYVPFSTLGDILAGNGIPEYLIVSLSSGTTSAPYIPEQPVKDFPLGIDYGEISGAYQFIAPLDFEVGSTIKYSKTEQGWSNKDLENLTITSLKVNVTVSSNLPIDLQFTGQPMNKFGRPIQGVTIEGATIKANTENQELEIYITGEIKYLDGITFEASGVSVESKPLTPDMKLTLTNLRPVVSGYFDKKL
ncbi:MAG: hypothetical protein K2K27_03790 [Muribaculaceae bacterium]|nr:hypothetical protein [Muribaculaceae bacterium]